MDQEVADRSRLQVGDLVVNTGTHQVSRGDTVIELPRLSFQLLMALADAAPNILTYDELIERVWTGRIVSQETVTQRVKLLRQALGDDAQEPRYIGIARGEGYRLLATVRFLAPEMAAAAESPQEKTRRRPRAAVATGAILLSLAAALLTWTLTRAPSPGSAPARASVPPGSLAVLPFINASNDPADLFLSEGFGDELREQLSQVPGLRIAARSSSVAFRDLSLGASDIAERLGVARLVAGTVTREDDRLRISVDIIDGESGLQSWSQNYSLHRRELLDVQSRIATEVVGQLALPAGESALRAKPVTRDVSANELMLLARHYEQQVREESIVEEAMLAKVIELYREAVVADPESAMAHSRLAGALLYQGEVKAAETPIFEALRLDPDLADAQYTLGLYYWLRRLPGSGAAFERAVKLNPNHADALSAYAKWVWHQGDGATPEKYFRRALALDPMSHRRYEDLGTFLGHSGRSQAARDLSAEIASRFDDGRACMVQARIFELVGDLDIAIGWALRAKQQRPGDAEVDWMIAELYARIGDFDQALRYEPEPGIGQLYWQRRYEELIELGESLLFERPGELATMYALARAYNATGRFQQAIHILSRARVPEIARVDSRHAPDIAAMAVLAEAYQAAEDLAAATDLAEWLLPFLQGLHDSGGSVTWWSNVLNACAWVILGDDQRALEALELAVSADGLVWYPLVVDTPCLETLRLEPQYQRTVGMLDHRMAGLRQRLPETLIAMGVTP